MTVLVVGGGISGLTAARELVARGVDVTVCEAGDRLGGVLGTERRGGYLLETAANGFLPAAGGAADLARELGVELVDAAPEARRRWIVRGGRLRALPASPSELVTSDVLGWRGKLSLLAEPLRPARPTAGESVAAFARRRLGGEAAEALVAPFVTGVFAGDADALELETAFPKLAALEARGGLVRGLLRQRWSERRQRSPRAGRGHRLRAPRLGVGALAEALARELGGRVRTGVRLSSLRRDGEAVVAELEGGAEERHAAAVLAVPAPVSAELVDRDAPALAGALGQIPYAPIAVVHLGYRREDIAHPLDGFGFLVVPGEPFGILGAVFESVLWPERAPEGEVLVRCMVGGARDPEALTADDAALVARAHGDLERVLGVRGRPRLENVVRWPRAIAQYTRGHGERVARAEHLAEERRLVLGGAAYRGVAVNDCVAGAARIADRVLRFAAATSLALALALAGCGGNKGRAQHAAADDGGDATALTGDPGASAAEGDPPGSGDLVVTPRWPWPPEALRQSPGRNPCGVAARPPLSVHVMGGVHDAVVEVVGTAPRAGETPVLVARDCRLEPAVVVAPAGAHIEIVSGAERPAQIEIARAGEASRSLPLRVAGHRYRVPTGEPGVLRVVSAGASGDPSYVFVSEHAARVTGERGSARFEGVPAGRHRVRAWHPPVTPKGAPLTAETEIEVEAGRTATGALPFER